MASVWLEKRSRSLCGFRKDGLGTVNDKGKGPYDKGMRNEPIQDEGEV